MHQGGASWDFVILQPAHHTDEESAKLDAAFKKLGIPQGAKFFVAFPAAHRRAHRHERGGDDGGGVPEEAGLSVVRVPLDSPAACRSRAWRWLSRTGSAAGEAPDLAVGRRLFESTCASCHGAQRTPDPSSPVVQALETAPADLSDPLFNSREPALDWELVVKHGGRALGLSKQMPAWGSAFTDAEIAALVAYVKTLAPGSERYPPGELNLMLPIRTQKAFPEDEVVWKSRLADQDGEDVWRNVLEFEKRFGRRGQGILELVEEEGELTEVEVGWKHALTWSLERGYLLSGGAKLAVPTEGDGSEELIPFLAWAQELSPRATLQASARAVLPVDDVDAGELELAGVVHYTWSDLAAARLSGARGDGHGAVRERRRRPRAVHGRAPGADRADPRRPRGAQPRRGDPAERPGLRLARAPHAAVGFRRRRLLQGLGPLASGAPEGAAFAPGGGQHI